MNAKMQESVSIATAEMMKAVEGVKKAIGTDYDKHQANSALVVNYIIANGGAQNVDLNLLKLAAMFRILADVKNEFEQIAGFKDSMELNAYARQQTLKRNLLVEVIPL